MKFQILTIRYIGTSDFESVTRRFPVDDEDRGDLETEEEAEVTRLNESEDEIVKPTPFINQN